MTPNPYQSPREDDRPKPAPLPFGLRVVSAILAALAGCYAAWVVFFVGVAVVDWLRWWFGF